MKSLILMFSITSTACTTVGVTQMKSDITPREMSCGLDIFSDEKEIDKPYEVVCLIDAKTGTSAFHNRTGAGAIDEARPAACRCGADGILVIGMGAEGDGFWIPKTGNATLKAIRYKSVD